MIISKTLQEDFEDLISFVSNNYMALGTLALVGSIGFYAGRRYVPKGESDNIKKIRFSNLYISVC